MVKNNYEKYINADLSILTSREKTFLQMKFTGMTDKQIADELNISSGTVNTTLLRAWDKLEGKETYAQKYYKKNREQINVAERPNYKKYINADLSILTSREKIFLQMKFTGMTDKQIADELNISSGTVNVMLRNARDKLEGKETYWRKYYKKNREQINVAERPNYKKYINADLSILTSREKIFLQMKFTGMTHKQIADELNISLSTVNTTLRNARDKLEGKETYRQKYYKKNHEQINVVKKHNYEKYIHSDLSILTSREKIFLQMKFTGMTHKQIADELNISSGTVNTTLLRAWDKLEGKETYAQKYYKKIVNR